MQVRGRESLPLVKAIQGDRRLIGNHRRGTNGRIGRQAIAGTATTIAAGRR